MLGSYVLVGSINLASSAADAIFAFVECYGDSGLIAFSSFTCSRSGALTDISTPTEATS